MKLTKGNLLKHIDEKFYIDELSKPLQQACTEALLPDFDYDGYMWHHKAKCYEQDLVEKLKKKGWLNPGIDSTESFCCQGDATCITAESIDNVDKFVEVYKKYFDGMRIERVKFILKNIFTVHIKGESGYEYGRNEITYPSLINYTIWIEDIISEDSCPRLFAFCNEIANAIESIVDDENRHSYEYMESAFDYWYSAENVKEYLLNNERCVSFDGSGWRIC